MTGTKHREAIFQHWRSAILRESRDLASLEQTGARALADPEVRADSTLEGMIRGEVAERRVEFLRPESPSEPQQNSKAPPSDRIYHSMDAPALFHRLSQEFQEAVRRADQVTARGIVDRMQMLKAEHPGVVPDSFEAFDRQIACLAEHSNLIRKEIATLAAESVAAAQRGDEPGVAQRLRRLTSIHAAQPAALDEVELDQIRHDVAQAGQQEVHRQAARRIIEREKVVAMELKNLAEAVHSLRDAVRGDSGIQVKPSGSGGVSPGIVRQVEEHGPNWLAGLVLELADLLAEWEHPPPEAQDQVDRFVERVRKALHQIRKELKEMDPQTPNGKAESAAATG
jgi:hypothetical protein